MQKSILENLASTIQEATTSYFHDSGLRSSPGQGRIDNDNPILQLMVFVAVVKRVTGTVPQVLKDWVSLAVSKTRIRDGYWTRSTDHEVTRLNSHDNYVALASVDNICGHESIAQEICDAGSRNGFVFDTDSDASYRFKAARQLGEVAYYKIAAERLPNLLELAWFAVGCLIQCFRPISFQHQLVWLRLETARYTLSKTLHKKAWIHANCVIFTLGLIFDLSLQLRYGSRFEHLMRYYSHEDKYPTRQVIRLIEGKVK